jgi:hypothetical protein
MVVSRLSSKSLPSIDAPLALSDVSRHSTIPAAASNKRTSRPCRKRVQSPGPGDNQKGMTEMIAARGTVTRNSSRRSGPRPAVVAWRQTRFTISLCEPGQLLHFLSKPLTLFSRERLDIAGQRLLGLAAHPVSASQFPVDPLQDLRTGGYLRRCNRDIQRPVLSGVCEVAARCCRARHPHCRERRLKLKENQTRRPRSIRAISTAAWGHNLPVRAWPPAE